MEVVERPFTIDEVKDADEAFITSATTFVQGVVEMDGEEMDLEMDTEEPEMEIAEEDLDEVVQLLKDKMVIAEPIRTDEFTNKRFTFIADPDNLPIELYEK